MLLGCTRRLRALLACASIVACSSPGARAIDAASADATALPPDASLCGNGVRDIDHGEQCDEGSNNGTMNGKCTRQCMQGDYPNFQIVSATPLPGHAIHDVVDAYLHGRHHIVIRDDNDIFLALGLNELSLGTNYHPPLLQLSTSGAATSLGWFEMRDQFTSASLTFYFPVWLERATNATSGGQGLYWAYLDETDTPVVRSIPYPFPDGTSGTLITPRGKRPMIVDQSSTPPYDILIAVMLPRSENDIAFTTARLPSRGLQRGVLAGNRLITDLTELAAANPPPRVHRILQFFKDTHKFSLFDIRQPSTSDEWGVSGPFSISEFSNGDWPFDVAAAADWREEGADANIASKDLTHPNPFAIIGTDGTVYVWKFDQSFSSDQETFWSPFGHVPAGTTIACAVFRGIYSSLWSLSPDGSVVFLTDGDGTNLASTALAPALVPTSPAVPAWSTAAIAPTFDETYGLFAADDVVYAAH